MAIDTPFRERAPASPRLGVRSRGALLGRLRQLQPYLYLLPALLAVGVWVYWPLIQTVELSFYRWNLLPTRPKVPVGFDNYLQVLTLPEMGIALRNTALYVIGLLPFSVILPLAFAIVTAGIGGPLRGVYRAVIFAPVLMAPVVVAVVWRWILHPTQGLVYHALQQPLGLPTINWFRDSMLSLPVIVFITGWGLLGFSFLIFTAGLTNIPREYVEAARIDGASSWQVARYITVPLLTPTISFMVMMTVLLGAQWVFPLINVLTQGGPQDATTNVYYILWQFGFRSFNVGWSSAAAVLFFAGFGVLAFLAVRLIDRFSIYDT
ncbi:MAG: sugar ABC transporter permease [Chloroflexota bacterium]|nr:sugar ABC transporter permease [Dehalococcoidia bacterium]MDW8252300.1 sugar ABC transporter permease [Chloroflexota bacterium]